MAASTWPVDYPFEAITDFDAATIAGCISLQTGEQGRVTAANQPSAAVCIQMTRTHDGGPGVLGWVPAKCVRTGTARKVTDAPAVAFSSSSQDAMAATAEIWVKNTAPGFLNFRRAGIPPRIRTDGDGVEKLVILQIGSWSAELSKDEPWLPKDALLDVVFEIRTDDQAHAIPLSRLRSVGPFSDWHHAREIGMRYEWHDGTQWLQRYYQVS